MITVVMITVVVVVVVVVFVIVVLSFKINYKCAALSVQRLRSLLTFVIL
jgi:hypothetical protein